MAKKAVILMLILLYPMVVHSENYFLPLREGNIYVGMSRSGEIISHFKKGETFVFSLSREVSENISWYKIYDVNNVVFVRYILTPEPLEIVMYFDTPETAKIAQRKILTFKPEIQKLIGVREVKVGMTKEQASLSWGPPDKVNETVDARGKHEQWVYGGRRFLYFDNEILTSFQISR